MILWRGGLMLEISQILAVDNYRVISDLACELYRVISNQICGLYRVINNQKPLYRFGLLATQTVHSPLNIYLQKCVTRVYARAFLTFFYINKFTLFVFNPKVSINYAN